MATELEAARRRVVSLIRGCVLRDVKLTHTLGAISPNDEY